jgi:hypothetical protein
MKTFLSKSVILSAVVAIALGIPPAAAIPGDETAANYSFREPPVNSLGIKSLAELRGKPVVIDFWGKN